jgi:predicted nucleotidyltransferase
VLNQLLKKLSIALNRHDIPYMVIGGQAAMLYREARFTNDIDITLGVGIEEIDKMLQICNELNLKILIENPKDFTTQTLVLPIYDSTSGFRIDLIFSYTQFERIAISRANLVDIDECKVSFCSLEDLIILKLFAGRSRDVDDVKIIIRKNPGYNRQFVLDNLREIGKAIDSDLESRLIDLEKK